MLLADNTETDTRAHEVEVPALIVLGGSDTDFPDPRAEAEYARQALSGPTEVLFLEGVGHYPHVECPELLTPALLDFLDRVCRARA